MFIWQQKGGWLANERFYVKSKRFFFISSNIFFLRFREKSKKWAENVCFSPVVAWTIILLFLNQRYCFPSAPGGIQFTRVVIFPQFKKDNLSGKWNMYFFWPIWKAENFRVTQLNPVNFRFTNSGKIPE